MKLLLFALLLIFPLGQLGRFEFQNLVIHINDLAVFFVVGFWFLTRRKNISKDPVFKPLGVWGLVMIVSLLVNLLKFPLHEVASSSLYIWRFLVYAGLYFVVKDHLSESKTILKLLQLGVLVVAIAGLLQFIFLPDVSFLKALEWDDHYYRAVSTFLDPGFTGAILVLGLVLFVSTKSFIQAIIVYIALALTYSRASYLMYLVSFASFSYFQKSAKIFIIAFLLLMITIPLLPKSTGEGTKLERENSITARLNNWNKSLEIWEENPIFGVGFNTYRYVIKVSPNSHSGGADNSLLLVLATTGVIGFAAYTYLIKRTWDIGDTIYKVSLLGVIVHSLFNNTLFYPWVMEWLWILLALKIKARTLS